MAEENSRLGEDFEVKLPGDNSWIGEAIVLVALIAAAVTLIVTGNGGWVLGVIIVGYMLLS